ncbi:MAG: hypothetical protein AABM43_00595 [Actinomycetota bacterium]
MAGQDGWVDGSDPIAAREILRSKKRILADPQGPSANEVAANILDRSELDSVSHTVWPPEPAAEQKVEADDAE